jgi:hypothetical protein
MLVNQFNIKVFEIEIEDENDFLDFIEKNRVILNSYLLSLHGNVTRRIERILDKNNLAYVKNMPIKNKNGVATPFMKSSSLKMLDSIVRSGQEIISDGDVLLLKRVNSGAKIKCNGNFIALDKVDALVECNGDFMLIKIGKSANVYFNGVNITENLDDKKLYNVKLEKNEILIY